MPQKIPQRLLWAVETLAVKPDDHLLEIGCGHGIAVSLICEKLVNGKITAIDRSDIAIQTAMKRNENHIASGRAEFQTAALHEANFDKPFKKIFAVNVNVFWLKPAKELTVLKNLLTPDGVLYLFYEPPSERAQEVADKVSKNLRENGFSVRDVIFKTLNSAMGVCVIAGI